MAGKCKSIQLLESELEHNMYDAPVNLVSIVAGDPSLDFLKDQTSQILAENPWLGSRLCTEDQTWIPALVHPEHMELEDFYKQIEISDICKSGETVDSLLMDINSTPLSPALANLFTTHGFNSLEGDSHLFKIRFGNPPILRGPEN